MFEVEITNFQSIKHMAFKFEGFTTIIGRNFIGKSATLRAINAALTNQQGTDFIRWGEKFCEVRLKTKGIDILWHKELNNNFYKINDEDPYDKMGNQPPPKPIIDAGFGIVEVNREKINLFYAQQFFPLFLIDRMDTKSADLIISIYGLDKLYKAIGLCAKDQRENSNLIKLRKNDFEQAERDLERFVDFEKVKQYFKSLETNKAGLISEQELIGKLQGWFSSLVVKTREINKFRPVREVIVPTGLELENNIIEFKRLKVFLQKILLIKTACLRLREVNSVVIPEAAGNQIDTKLIELNKIKNFNIRYDKINGQVESINSIKGVVIPDISDDKINNVIKLKDLYQRTETAAIEVKRLKAAVVEASKQLEKVDTKLKVYDHCPACGSKLAS